MIHKYYFWNISQTSVETKQSIFFHAIISSIVLKKDAGDGFSLRVLQFFFLKKILCNTNWRLALAISRFVVNALPENFKIVAQNWVEEINQKRIDFKVLKSIRFLDKYKGNHVPVLTNSSLYRL